MFFTLLFRKNCKNNPIFIQLKKKKSNKCIFLPCEQYLQTCYVLDCWGKEIYSTSDLTNIAYIQYWMNVKAVIETLDGSSLQWDNEFNKLYSSPQSQNQQIWYSIQWRTHYSQIMIHKNCICQFSSKHAAVGCWKWTSG